MFLKLTYQRIIKWAVGLLVLLGLILVSLPFGIQLGIERGLVRLGAEQAIVKDVDFNPFLGRLIVKGVRAKAGEAPPLLLDEARLQIAWWPLWSRQLVVEELLVKGLQVVVDQARDGKLLMAGMMLPADEQSAEQEQDKATPADQKWGIGVRYSHFESSNVNYHAEQLDLVLRINAFELSRLFSYAEATPTTASFDGAINGAPLKIALQGTPFSEPRYAKGSIQLQAFGLDGLNRFLPPVIKELKGHMGINIDLEAQQNLKGDFKLGIKGNTNLSDLGLQIPEQKIAVSHESLAWQGAVNIAQQAKKLRWQIDGDIKGTRSTVVQLINGERVPLFTAAAIDISGINVFETPSVAIDRVQLDSVRLRLAKASDGTLQLPGATAVQPDGSRDTASKQAAEKEASVVEPKIRLGQFKISGDSVLHFEDDSVKPPFKLNLQLSELSLKGLDNTQPSQPAVLKMAGKFDEFSNMTLDGTLYPFSEKLTLDLVGKISSLELPPFSSYVVPVLGYNLDSGQLDAELSFKVDKGVINSENKLKINQLTLDPSDPDKIAKFSKQLTMPLDAALSLLRDKEDNIQLKIPITGDLGNPKFDIADAINQSLSTAMQFAAMSYIKLVLQPYASLVSIYQVVDSAGRMVNAVRLDPVNFDTGHSRLGEEAENYLDNTIKLLESRPKLNLKICGKATRADLALLLKKQSQEQDQQQLDTERSKKESPGLTEADEKLLFQLARDRSVAIKNYLVTQGAVEAKNLFICNPAIDLDEAAVSRVELRI